MSERIRVARVAEIMDLSPRAVQKMANKIPSAVRFGKVWTFREEAVREWVQRKERETWLGTSIDAARSGGAAFSPTTRNYAKAYEQLVRPKRSKGSQTGKTA